MIQYLHDCIRATAGEDIYICAKIVDAFGDIVPACSISLFDDNELIVMVEGKLVDDIWEFHIPADATTNLCGRYWYSISDENHSSLCFKEPIYLL